MLVAVVVVVEVVIGRLVVVLVVVRGAFDWEAGCGLGLSTNKSDNMENKPESAKVK